eukprot:CAMPEP_0170166820 /NCGR_PEP_ID=MMETSP0040_2-20121228/401_1 /TAXON_ID=641309 /ORGANISM="Lotharella oceanica, Strain CCMP622" /LENGTH=112 /DNA_ID=CAMNT_0010404651 /DNA_START=1 /DNA_END=339 /DNA_ORIENTATION=+
MEPKSAFLLLVLAACLTPVSAGREHERSVENRVRQFIFDNYDKYQQGQLTHRMMKMDVGDALGRSYKEVKANRDLCLLIETEVERITQVCDEGRTTDRNCVYSQILDNKEEL